MQEEISVFYPACVSDWDAWLKEHHLSRQSVWVVFYNKKSGKKTISWSEAVDVALCYGWIDSKKIRVDEETAHQFFSRRKAKSTWSKINKDKVAKLIEAGLMAQAGLEAVALAKQNGSWTSLDEVEALTIPADLETAFGNNAGSKDFFAGLSKSVRKAMLQWIVLARRPETRRQRITEIVELAAKNMKPKQF